jgi:hypothetical protein
MSSRSALRRKVVLPVTLTRYGGQEKQLAHTLDITETSARLGGLTSSLKPGEIVELYRGVRKARFEVVWMGEQGGAMAGQAGVRSLEPNKIIWSVDLPGDQMDSSVPIHSLRNTRQPVQTQTQFPNERRWHSRFACTGSAAIKHGDCAFLINGEVKDISQGGLYVELSTPLPVNAKINMNVCVEGVCFDTAGVVRTSYPLLGMGISFHNLDPENALRLNAILQAFQTQSPSETVDSPEPATASLRQIDLNTKPEHPAQVLARACRMLSHDFDSWERGQSSDDVRELRDAIYQLHRKLSLRLDPDLHDFHRAELNGDQSRPSVSPAL